MLGKRAHFRNRGKGQRSSKAVIITLSLSAFVLIFKLFYRGLQGCLCAQEVCWWCEGMSGCWSSHFRCSLWTLCWWRSQLQVQLSRCRCLLLVNNDNNDDGDDDNNNDDDNDNNDDGDDVWNPVNISIYKIIWKDLAELFSTENKHFVTSYFFLFFSLDEEKVSKYIFELTLTQKFSSTWK